MQKKPVKKKIVKKDEGMPLSEAVQIKRPRTTVRKPK